MKSYFLNIYLILLPLLFMPSVLLGAELRQVHVEWDYPSSVSGLTGFQLYLDGNEVPDCTAGPTARQVDCQISLEDGQTYNFSLKAVGDGSIPDSDYSASYPVTVSGYTPPVNHAPTISGTPATTVAEDVSYSFTPAANDIDSGDRLTFSIANKPSWASFNTTNGRLSGTPENNDVGTTSNIVITVSDSSGASASLSAFNLNVTAVIKIDTKNLVWDPVLEDVAGYKVYYGNVSQTYGVPVDVGNQTSYSLAEFAPGQTYYFAVKSYNTAGVESDFSEELEWTNTGSTPLANQPPVATNSNLVATEDTVASGSLSASDREGDSLIYNIVSNGSKGVVTISNASTGAFSYSPIANATGMDTFTFKVNDGKVDSNVATVTVNINDINDVPIISGTPAKSVAEDVTYIFIPTASDLDAGDTLTFSITNKPVWASFNTTTGTLSGNPGNGDVGTTTGIRITVTDGSGASASLQAFDLEVLSTVLPGDVNCDGVVSLKDLYLTGGILLGQTPSSPICKEADVDGDGVIGQEEHKYILKMVSPGAKSNTGVDACTVDPDGTWIEAENYTSMGIGNRTWEIRNYPNDSGVSNSAYMHTTTGGTGTSTDGSQTDYDGLEFPDTAIYYFWIRAKNPQSGNSTWVGVDGNEVGALTQNSSNWVWDNSVQEGTGSNNVEITVGTHSLTMWPREQDQWTDGVLISTNPNAVSDNSQSPSPPAGFKVIDPRQCP